jgi:hypothetical protein
MPLDSTKDGLLYGNHVFLMIAFSDSPKPVNHQQ